jgi:hypothetical protein
LLEPQRTNLFTFSESFNNAAWVKDGATITANAAVSPDGYTNADLQTGGSIYQQQTQPNATACTMSVFVKKSTASNVTIGYIDTSVTFVGGAITYTYATNTITVSQSANASVSGEAVSYGNGWYRLIIKYTSAALVTFNYQYISAGGSFIYGAQFETSAAYATSYIPTLGASVTRVADVATKTGISSLIGSTAGTVFIDAIMNTGTTQNADIFLLRGAGTGAIVMFLAQASGNINLYLNTAGLVPTIKSGNNRGQRVKVAISYQSGSLVAYVNGVQTLSTGYTIEPDLADLYINTNDIGTAKENTILSEFLLFKTALTNAQLAELTAL